jgi:hypothetical protein
LTLERRWKRPRSGEAARLIRVDVLLPTRQPTAQRRGVRVMKSQENVVVGLVVSGRVTDREVAALIQT